jgi:hypothetical protein
LFFIYVIYLCGFGGGAAEALEIEYAGLIEAGGARGAGYFFARIRPLPVDFIGPAPAAISNAATTAITATANAAATAVVVTATDAAAVDLAGK